MNRKSKTKYGEKFPMTRPIAQIREELKQKPESKAGDVQHSQSERHSAGGRRRTGLEMDLFKHALAVPLPENQSDVGQPGDGLVQPLPGDREPMFL